MDGPKSIDDIIALFERGVIVPLEDGRKMFVQGTETERKPEIAETPESESNPAVDDL